jgi:catechol 2,3-dioxygenase-like lactoylglutathione lyase family enzyme
MDSAPGQRGPDNFAHRGRVAGTERSGNAQPAMRPEVFRRGLIRVGHPRQHGPALPIRSRAALCPKSAVSFRSVANIELVALVVRDYDPAIRFFVDVLQFELIEDTPSLTNDGRPKRWVIVRPGGARTGILLARADGEHQVQAAGQQFAGRVGLFLRVEDFEASYQRMAEAGVRFVSAPRREPYGQVAVFLDIEGNRWDLLGPDPRQTSVDTRAV